jgi:hypothetical protein
MTNNIHEAIAEIRACVGHVAPTPGKTLGYDYTSEHSIVDALRAKMVELQVYGHVVDVTHIESSTFTTSRGAVMQMTRLVARLRLEHAPSGTSIEACAAGAGADVGEKAPQKAMAVAVRICLQQTFMIGSRKESGQQSAASNQRSERGDTRPQPAVSRPAPVAPAVAPKAPSMADATNVYLTLGQKARDLGIVPESIAGKTVEQIAPMLRKLQAQVDAALRQAQGAQRVGTGARQAAAAERF